MSTISPTQVMCMLSFSPITATAFALVSQEEYWLVSVPLSPSSSMGNILTEWGVNSEWWFHSRAGIQPPWGFQTGTFITVASVITRVSRSDPTSCFALWISHLLLVLLHILKYRFLNHNSPCLVALSSIEKRAVEQCVAWAQNLDCLGTRPDSTAYQLFALDLTSNLVFVTCKMRQQ